MTLSNQFVLEATLKKERIVVSVHEQGSAVFHYEEMSISVGEIHKLCDAITSLLNKGNELGELASRLAKELEQNGQLLYDQLLPNSVKLKLKSLKEQTLLLLIDEDLVHIPWELLYDGEDYLCFKFSLGRSVITRESITAFVQRTMHDPLRMMIFADPVGDLPSARREMTELRELLDRQNFSLHVSTKSKEITRYYLKKNIRDYDIVHFAGHTEYDAERPMKSGWQLSDGTLTASEIKQMGATSALPSLVFANSCQSALSHSLLLQTDSEQKFFGLANAFLLSGVRQFIGTLWKIPDNIALSFAKAFYRYVNEGRTIGDALRLARTVIKKEFGEDNIAWACYVLYGDPATYLVPGEKFHNVFDWRIFFKKPSSLIGLFVLFAMMCISVFFMQYRQITQSNLLQERMQYAQRLIKKNEIEKAKVVYLEILEHNVLNAQVHNGLARLYYSLRDFEQAYHYYSQARNIWMRLPNSQVASIGAHINMGRTLYSQGEYARALETFRAVDSSLTRVNKNHLLIENQFNQLVVLLTIGDFQAAEQYIQEILNNSELPGKGIFHFVGQWGLYAMSLQQNQLEKVDSFNASISKAIDRYQSQDISSEDFKVLFAYYSLLANTYANMDSYEQAIFLNRVVLDFAEIIDDTQYLSDAHLRLADRYRAYLLYLHTFFGQERRLASGIIEDDVLQHYQKAREFLPIEKEPLKEAFIYSGLGYMYQLKENPTEAILKYENAVDLFEHRRELDLYSRLELIDVYIELAKLYVDANFNFRDSLVNLEKLNRMDLGHVIDQNRVKKKLKIVRNKFDLLLRIINLQGYSDTQFYRKALRIYNEFSAKL